MIFANNFSHPIKCAGREVLFYTVVEEEIRRGNEYTLFQDRWKRPFMAPWRWGKRGSRASFVPSHEVVKLPLFHCHFFYKQNGVNQTQ